MSEVIRKQLFALQDQAYRDFQSRLVPTLPKEKVIGVRIPALRKLSATLTGTAEATYFLRELPHEYYEEDNLHAFLVERIKDYNECIEAVNDFLPYVNNWATCDTFHPKVFGKHTDELKSQIAVWIQSSHVYTVRYAVGMLLRYFLDGRFDATYLAMVAELDSDEYYIKMMNAWYFATALAKQYDSTIHYFKEKLLPVWTHNKAIQKAIESYRIPQQTKVYLKTLRR